MPPETRSSSRSWPANAGDSVDLTDVLLAGEGSDLKSTAGLIVAAEIIAQAKADKVTVFKKRRRHNYRRKAGHRQQHTILKIVSIGGKKAEKKAAPKAEAARPKSRLLHLRRPRSPPPRRRPLLRRPRRLRPKEAAPQGCEVDKGCCTC